MKKYSTSILIIVVFALLGGLIACHFGRDGQDQVAAAAKASGRETISGVYTIGTTYKEDFAKKKFSTETFIYINGKAEKFEAQNILTEISSGSYMVSGYREKGKLFLTSIRPNANDSAKIGALAEELRGERSVTPRNVAVFLVDFQDTATQPFYPADIDQKMFGTGTFSKYFKENSYGKQSITGDVFGWFTLNRNAGGCFVDPQTDLSTMVSGNPINLADFNHIVIVTNCTNPTSYGMSTTGPQPYVINGITYNIPVSWVMTSANKFSLPSDGSYETLATPFPLTTLDYLLMHEFSHSLGFHHAHGLNCVGTVPNAECSGMAVGNYYDILSYNQLALHMSGWEKNRLGWFTGNEIRTITQSGTYTLTNLEAPSVALGTRTFRIKPSVNSGKTPIWLEYRGGVGFDYGLNTPINGGIDGNGNVPIYDIRNNQKGLFIYKEGFEGMYGGMLNPPSAYLMYLRNSPNLGTGGNPYEVSMNAPGTWSEPRYGLTITAMPLPNPMSTTLPFQITMDPNLPCTSLPPKAELHLVPPTTASVGTVWGVWPRLVNMDYISCPSSNFTVTLGTGLPGTITPNNFNSPNMISFLSNLAPDDERVPSPNVYIAPGTPTGQYTIPFIFTNTTSGLSTTLNVPLTIQ